MKIFSSFQGARGKPGKGAGKGQTGNEIVCPISATNITAQQMTQTIEKYKEFAESEMVNHVRQITLKKFIKEMQQNEKAEKQHEIIHDEM